MKKTWRVRLGVVALVAVLAFGAVGSVFAQGPDNAPRGGQGTRLPKELLDAVVEATGLSAEDVLAHLREGQTLAEVCTANGVDPQTVIDTVKAAKTAEIQQALADGTITQQQADRRIGLLDEVLDRAMNAQLPDRPAAQHPLAARAVRELAGIMGEKTGLTPREILDEMRDGKTLADIATEHGQDPDAIAAEALTRTTDTLRAAVQEGKITQEQMDTLVAAAGEFYPQAMNQPLPDRFDRATPVRDRLQDRLDNSLIGALAEAAGVEPRDILREVFEPRPLAEVAAAHGVDVDALVSAAEARITEEIDQAVTDGKITQAQADKLLEGLHDRLVARINGAIGPQRPVGQFQ